MAVINLQPDLFALCLLLIAASISDVRTNKIPNLLVLCGLVGAILFHGFSPLGHGIAHALGGGGIGLLALLPLYAIGTMGAGDVKLMAMVGAFIGPLAIVGAIVGSFVAGGVLALAAAAYKGKLHALYNNVVFLLLHTHFSSNSLDKSDRQPTFSSVGNLPYALAITAGTMLQLVLTQA